MRRLSQPPIVKLSDSFRHNVKATSKIPAVRPRGRIPVGWRKRPKSCCDLPSLPQSRSVGCAEDTPRGDRPNRGNRIHDGKQNGVFVFENGQGTLENNEIFANARSGVPISQGGNPTLRRNRVSTNGYEAVRIQKGGCGVVEDNDLSGNTRGAWNIEVACEEHVQRARNRK